MQAGEDDRRGSRRRCEGAYGRDGRSWRDFGSPGRTTCRSHALRAEPMICALGGIRTPNLLIRSQMLYPLSYERTLLAGVPEER